MRRVPCTIHVLTPVKPPDQSGDQATRRVEQEGFRRAVCDYVAGMTYRFLLEEHARLIG
ncbi:MAG: hypothetical protein ACREIF_05385 [Chthoniobacterales bacterium]